MGVAAGVFFGAGSFEFYAVALYGGAAFGEDFDYVVGGAGGRPRGRRVVRMTTTVGVRKRRLARLRLWELVGEIVR